MTENIQFDGYDVWETMCSGKPSPPDEVLINILSCRVLQFLRLCTQLLKRRHTDLNGLKPSLACKILDSMISPILTYNSEVWGAFVKSDFKSWDSSARKPIYNSVNALIYKYMHTGKASNIACTAELGKFPKIIDINKKILNYFSYFKDKDEDSIVKQALKISVDPYYSGENSFYSNLMKMVDYYDLNCDFPCIIH